MNRCQVTPPSNAVSLSGASRSTPVPSEPFPFLRLPSELRDQIYEYLLSTEHTKQKLTYDKPVSSKYLKTNTMEIDRFFSVGMINVDHAGPNTVIRFILQFFESINRSTKRLSGFSTAVASLWR